MTTMGDPRAAVEASRNVRLARWAARFMRTPEGQEIQAKYRTAVAEEFDRRVIYGDGRSVLFSGVQATTIDPLPVVTFWALS